MIQMDLRGHWSSVCPTLLCNPRRSHVGPFELFFLRQPVKKVQCFCCAFFCTAREDLVHLGTHPGRPTGKTTIRRQGKTLVLFAITLLFQDRINPACLPRCFWPSHVRSPLRSCCVSRKVRPLRPHSAWFSFLRCSGGQS